MENVSQSGGVIGRGGQPMVYLSSQVLARETEPQFALVLSADQVAALRDGGVVPGSRISVVDAAQDYFTCEVVSFDETPICRIATRTQDALTSAVYLVQGLCEDEVMDTIVRQTTEIGIAGFSFFTSHFSAHPDPVRYDERRDRWTSLARYAALQSGQPYLPQVGGIIDLDATCDLLGRFDAVVLCWEGETRRTMADAVGQIKRWGMDRQADIALVIGPRGGITDGEMARLGSANGRLLTVTLGPAILRVETAGIVAPTLLISALGGLR
ncbi:MAG: RsmE family RNA methyltransferase [Eggerthellaceae bacterium]